MNRYLSRYLDRYRSLGLLAALSLAGCGAGHYALREDGKVDLYLNHSGAEEVLFASSADDYRIHRAKRSGRDLWVVEDLADREFRYFYLVDDRLFLPDCPYRETDDFGRQNCIHQPLGR